MDCLVIIYSLMGCGPCCLVVAIFLVQGVAVVERISALHIKAVTDVTGATPISSISPSFGGNKPSFLGSVARVSTVFVGKRRWVSETKPLVLFGLGISCCVGVSYFKELFPTDPCYSLPIPNWLQRNWRELSSQLVSWVWNPHFVYAKKHCFAFMQKIGFYNVQQDCCNEMKKPCCWPYQLIKK